MYENPIENSHLHDMKPTVAIVDWNWMGHHPTYFVNLVMGFTNIGCRVAAFCPVDAVEELLREFSTNQHVTVDSFRYQHPKARLPLILRNIENAWRHFGGLEKVLRNWEREHATSIDLVFFSTIYDWQFETFEHSKPWFARQWSGIYLHARAFRMPGSPIPGFNRLPCPEKIFTHPQMSSVCLIDEGAVNSMQALTNGKPAFEFPDITGTEVETPLDGLTLSGKLLRFANGRKIVVCLGYLQKTKGLIELCNAANDPCTSEICFFFGGEVSWVDLTPEEVRLIKTTWEKAPNVMTHLARLSDDTMNALIKVSDAVFAAYTDFPNSSNIMTKAAMLERPILVSDGYLMAERVRKYRLGSVVPEGSVEDITRELLGICEQGRTPDANYKGYYSNHSPEALKTALAKVIAAIKR